MTDTKTHHLLPCPFCGGDARHDAHADDCYFVLHRELNKAPDADLSLHTEVLAAWNRRSPQAVAGGEPVYAFRRKGLDDFCTCDARRYAELSTKPNLFEVRVFYTAPQPVGEPVAWQGAHDPTDLYYRKPPQADVHPLYRAAPQPAPVREPLTPAQITAAAKKLAECMDYPWEHMPEQGRAEMRKHAQAVLAAAHGGTSPPPAP